jgi:hypothetical protein
MDSREKFRSLRYWDHVDEGANYDHCYPDELLETLVTRAHEGFTDLGCRRARADTGDAVHRILNEAWARFWKDPASYHAWEKDAAARLFDLCNAPVSAATVKVAR